MSEKVLAWSTMIWSDTPEPQPRELYGDSLLLAVQNRWNRSSDDPDRKFIPGLLGANLCVTVISGTGDIEVVIANDVNQVEVKNIKPNFVVLTELN
jgi:hypothetical protein